MHLRPRPRPVTARLLSAGLASLTVLTLSSCGSDDGSGGGGSDTERAEKEVEKVTGDNDVDLKGDSPLDAIAYGIIAAQSTKYDDYEIDGDTVRVFVKDGVTLSGSECVIISAATSADHPDTTFVIVDGDEEITC